jgi:predicted Zn-dependent protease
MDEQQQPRGFRLSPTIIIALVMAAFTLFKYYSSSSVNEITGEKQHINVTPEQEISMGLQSAPGMAQQFGGLSTNQQAAALVKQVGQKVLQHSDASKTPYHYDFHLLGDRQTINAFALPGGQVFITEALLSRLTSDGKTLNEDMLAGVLGHEMGHVVARHSAAKLSQMELTQGLANAATMATYDPNNPNTSYIAQMVSNMLQLKYDRNQELQADNLGVGFMMEAGYDPENLIGVMEILKQVSGPNRVPEYQSTHPNPENRAQKIKEAIQEWKAKLGK